MKIIVDKLPESPRACSFSEHNCEYGYICRLRPLIQDDVVHSRKPIIRCKSVEDCPCLIEVKEGYCDQV